MRSAALLLIMAMLAGAQQQSGNTNAGSIKGTVVDSVTRQPIRKAVVVLIPFSPVGPQGAVEGQSPSGPQTQTTGAAGTFEMENLQPGQYLLQVRHDQYPQLRSGGVQRTVSIKAGERETPVVVELIPGASVTGRIVDEDGDPLSGCDVRLQSAKPPYQEDVMGGYRGRGSSEEGEYRLTGIGAGKYLLIARCQATVFEPRPLSAGPNPPPSLAYPPLFYPAAASAELAEAIELVPGTEKSGIDFQMKPAHVTHIHVTLAGGADWQGRKDLAWQLIPAQQGTAGGGFGGWRPVPATEGAFDIPKVFPGSYRLLVSSNVVFSSGDATGSLIGAAQQIDAGDKPLDVQLSLRGAVEVNGTVEIEASSGADRAKLNELVVQIVPEYAFYQGSGQPEAVKEDGTFTIKSTFPGPCRVRISGPSAFLKSAWYGGAPLTGGLLDLSSGARGDLRIVVSTNTATIQGTATPMAQVLAAPMELGWTGGIMSAQADANGQFKLDGLAPGKYRVGLQEQIDSGAGRGVQEVTLEEGQTVVVELKSAGGAP